VQFEDISGTGIDEIPNAPVYEAVIDFRNNNRVLLATEIGVFGTDNAFNITDSVETVAADPNYVAADTTITPQDTIIIITDSIIPADSTIIYDTIVVFDTLFIPTRIRIDSSVIPPDTMILDSVRIIRSNFSLSNKDTLIVPADTIVLSMDTTITFADTMYVKADTIYTAVQYRYIADANVKWTEENTGLGRVPVHAIKQMTFNWEQGARNQGKIYIGTHGRGIFETDQFVGIEEPSGIETAKSTKKDQLLVYPNPVIDNMKVDLNTSAAGVANIQVYSLTGQLVMEQSQNLIKGKNILSLEMDDLNRGTYIIRTIQNGVTSTGKFIKQ
jgi:hypothetical protein